MGDFKKFLNERELNNIVENIKLFEYKTYKEIPGTKTSYRIDSGDVNKNTVKHAHVYAKPNGKGTELYSVNITGTGHDGSSGCEISKKHANYFRSKGFEIPQDNILEVLSIDSLDNTNQELMIFDDISTLREVLEKISE